MHVYDWACNIFLPMATCKCCMLAKLQPHYLSSLTTMPHKQNTYEIVLRDLHWHRPYKKQLGTEIIYQPTFNRYWG